MKRRGRVKDVSILYIYDSWKWRKIDGGFWRAE
jgi:hypothetical protein